MESNLKQIPNDFPSNMGQKWTIEEENILLSELEKNLDIEMIAFTHNRTRGGIIGKQRNIAYNMYLKNISIEEIIIKTKLNREQITDIIAQKENRIKHVKPVTPVKPKNQVTKIKPKQFSLENEVIEIKNEIKHLKTTINELVEMMKAVYEFENT